MKFSSASTIRVLLVCTALAGPLAACSGSSEPISLEEQAQNLKEDLSLLFSGEDEKIQAPIGLYDAMARGIKYNIAHRVAIGEEMIASGDVSLKRIQMLPSLTAKGAYLGRDNPEMISADGATSGTETLPSSIFEDRYRQTASLDLSWNLLDAGLSYAQTRAASNQERAALERRRHVVQNLAQDIRFAYWRAVSAQVLDNHIAGLTQQAHDMARRLEEEETRKGGAETGPLLALQKRLYDTLRDLLAERENLATAKAELAALIGVPPETPLRLAAQEGDVMAAGSLPKLKTDRADLEVLALLLRPDMREQTLIRRIAAQGPRTAVMETFPGLSAMMGTHYDSNSFLKDSVWQGGAVSLTGDLVKLFTLPVRLEQAENRQKLADMQRMAVVAGVITQMNLSTLRYDLARENYDLLKKTMGVNRRIVEYYRARQENSHLLTEGYLLSAEMDQVLTRARLHRAYAEGQNAFGQVLGTIGLDPLPLGLEDKPLTEMANILESRFDTLDEGVIAALLKAIREKTDLLTPNGPVKSPLHPVPASASVAPALALVESST